MLVKMRMTHLWCNGLLSVKMPLHLPPRRHIPCMSLPREGTTWRFHWKEKPIIKLDIFPPFGSWMTSWSSMRFWNHHSCTSKQENRLFSWNREVMRTTTCLTTPNDIPLWFEDIRSWCSRSFPNWKQQPPAEKTETACPPAADGQIWHNWLRTCKSPQWMPREWSGGLLGQVEN